MSTQKFQELGHAYRRLTGKERIDSVPIIHGSNKFHREKNLAVNLIKANCRVCLSFFVFFVFFCVKEMKMMTVTMITKTMTWICGKR